MKREEYLKEIMFRKVSEVKEAEYIKEPAELREQWIHTKTEFNTRIENINVDCDRNFMYLIGDEDYSKTAILKKEINTPIRRKTHIAQQIGDYMRKTEDLVISYQEMDMNKTNYIKKLNFFMESAMEILRENFELIKRLEEDIENSKTGKWQGEFRIKAYNIIKKNWSEKIGHRIGNIKQSIEMNMEDDAIKKKKKKEIIDEVYSQIKKEMNPIENEEPTE